MRALLAWLMVFVGGLPILYGVGSALLALIGLYEANITDPLNQPEGAERTIAAEMFRAVIIGGVGVPIFIVGAVMLKITLIQRITRARRAK